MTFLEKYQRFLDWFGEVTRANRLSDGESFLLVVGAAVVSAGISVFFAYKGFILFSCAMAYTALFCAYVAGQIAVVIKMKEGERQ